MALGSNPVLVALDNMHHRKCYICETKEALAIAVAHFNADGDRFNWGNLLLACHRYHSNIKLAKYNEMLEPCDISIDVVSVIRLDVQKSPNSHINIGKVVALPGVEQTVELLDKVFNSNDVIIETPIQ